MSEKHDKTHEALEAKLDRVDELVSSLVDEVITDSEVSELEALLLDSAEARTRYIEGVQIHCDLVEHYRPAELKKAMSVSPVLGFLGPEDSSIALPPIKPADQS